MANILTEYVAMQDDMRMKVINKELPLLSVVEYQELNYRIDVLETFKALTVTAPVTFEVKEIGFHYQLTERLLIALTSEHKFGPVVNGESKEKRATALLAVERVIHDCRKKFRSFKAASPDQYKTDITKFIGAVLNVWIQYRNAYIKI